MELLNPEIEKLFLQALPKDEFEFIIDQKQMNLSKFMTLLKYIGYQHSKNKLPILKETTLDVSMSDGLNSYRITVKNKDNIQTVLNNHYIKKNIQVFHALLQESSSGIVDYEIMNKVRKGVIEHSKYKCRLATENKISAKDIKLNENDKYNIIYRYKQRASLILDDNEYGKIQLDVTQVQQSTQLSTLLTSQIRYEAELEFMVRKKMTDKKILIKIMTHLKSILGTLQGSDIIINQDEINIVIDEYKKLVYNDKINTHQDLYAMQSKSLELLPFIDILANQYTVTDKADGERHFLFCYKDSTYLISNNLTVRKININASEYNNTILDGEVISMNNKQIFLAFDILFDRGIDMRIEVNLSTRYLRLKNVIENLTKTEYSWIKLEPAEKFSIENQVKFHENNMDKHYELLNKYINNDDMYVVFLKYFIFPTGGEKSEIYAYANAMWNRYTTIYKLPYNLDGLIFTPIKQKYTRNVKDIQYQIFKWKPAEHNSIDLYIEFERDVKTKEIVTVFDNSNIIMNESGETDAEEFRDAPEEKDALYQIAKLYVGRVNRETNIEIPVFFKPDQELNQAHLFLIDGAVRDIEGNIIQDKTVVEFAYDTFSNRDPKKKWIAIRTRFDKTEQVQKFKRKYGNSEQVANSVWQSMNFMIDMNDFSLLGNPTTYTTHINILRSKLTAKDIAIYRASDAYYQKNSNIGKTYRNFHNFIKSQYIYNYCASVDNKKFDVLDIGFGQGGDIGKYYHAKVKSITGIDINSEGLFTGATSAIGRITNMKKTKPNFPPYDIAQASFDISMFDPDKQSKSIPSMTEANKKVLQKIAGKTYDVICAMFMFHYLFRNEVGVNTMINNFKLLKKDGYFLACLFDGDILHKMFKEKKIIEEYYTTDSGDKELLFTIKPLYNVEEEKNLNKPGLSISIFNSGFMESSSEFIEYIVTPQYLIDTMKKAGLELVETETFQNIYALSKDFLFNAVSMDAGKDTQKFLLDVREYYNMNVSINKAAFELTRLNRFYVFRKTI